MATVNVSILKKKNNQHDTQKSEQIIILNY